MNTNLSKYNCGNYCRIDYVFYKVRKSSNVKSVETVYHNVVDRKTFGMSLSDHSWVDAILRISFHN